MSGRKPRIGVVTFPGSLDDRDALRAATFMGGEGVPLWHSEHDLHGVDAVILPGGFSYGDYLRTGAIARFAALMDEVRTFADAGGPVATTGSATASHSSYARYALRRAGALGRAGDRAPYAPDSG